MKHRTTAVFLWLPIAASLLPAQGRAPEHLLRLSFAEGQKTRWQVTSECAVRLGSADRAPGQVTLLKLTLEATVEAVADTGATIAYKIDRLVYSNGFDLHYDSAEDRQPGESIDRIAAIVGRDIVVKVDNRGRVKKRRIPDELAHLDRNIDSVFYTFTDMILPFAPELPEKPVARGARWQGSSNPQPENAAKAVVHRSRYELLSVEKGVARIRHELLVSLADDSDLKHKRHYRRTERIVTLDLRRGAFVGENSEDAVRDGQGTGTRRGDAMVMQVKRTAEESTADDTRKNRRDA